MVTVPHLFDVAVGQATRTQLPGTENMAKAQGGSAGEAGGGGSAGEEEESAAMVETRRGRGHGTNPNECVVLCLVLCFLL